MVINHPTDKFSSFLKHTYFADIANKENCVSERQSFKRSRKENADPGSREKFTIY